MDLAGRKNGEVATVADIARRRQIPAQYLEQILLLLKRGGMVKSLRGRQGGYILARKGAKANMADILALTDDSFLAQPEAGLGTDAAERAVLKYWRQLNVQFLEALRQVSVQDLCDETESVSTPNYTI